MRVRDFMTSNVATAEPDTSLEEIATRMREEDTGAIPVVEGGELLGIVTDRDIVLRCVADGKHPSEVVAEDAMSSDLETVEADADIAQASQIMSEKQIRRLPVVESGRFVGMLSLGDISVKERKHPESQAGGALKQISHGVKMEKPARSGETATQKKSAGAKAKQGIANRSAAEEQKRQSRVIPFREQEASTRRRKTG